MVVKKNLEFKTVKRAVPPYLYFCNDERVKVKAEHPDYSNKEILQVVGQRWKDLLESHPDLHQHYMELGAQDKLRYEHEKQDLKPSVVADVPSVDIPKKRKSTKVSKVSKDVLPPVSPVVPVVEEKTPPPVKQRKSKKSVESKSKEVVQVSAPVVLVEEVEKSKVPKTTAYIRFSKVQRDVVRTEMPHLAPKDVSLEVARRWKSLSDVEKQSYTQ
jgi:hypothetical protein